MCRDTVKTVTDLSIRALSDPDLVFHFDRGRQSYLRSDNTKIPLSRELADLVSIVWPKRPGGTMTLYRLIKALTKAEERYGTTDPTSVGDSGQIVWGLDGAPGPERP